uniref:30S ribosomal protein S15 n=1 Tax=Zygnema circumcarinatum TaxID=35869 RepID=A0A6N0GXC9_ZYGCR|nr:ribosomal protein S15 [Zygnema circumcarinatum]
MTQNISIRQRQKFRQDCGSPEAQISFLTVRVLRISSHLKMHIKDYSSKRGLRKVLGTRKRLLSYLCREDVSRYNKLLNNLGIRPIKK